MRFAIRPAKLGDAEGIARAHTASWQSSYRGILPDAVLARIDVDQRTASWRRVLQDRSVLTLVAYDITHHDIVGFCDAGPSRGSSGYAAEVYRIYIEHHAKRHGLGREMFEQVTDWLRAQQLRSLIIWVLDLGRNVESGLGAVFSYLSVVRHYDDFTKGVVDTSSLIYYVSFMFLFIFLTVRSVDSMRWRRA